MRLAGLLICVCVLFAQAASAADPSYTLNPGDQLVVSSFDDERLNREVVVLPDGTISYLAIGQLKAQGNVSLVVAPWNGMIGKLDEKEKAVAAAG